MNNLKRLEPIFLFFGSLLLFLYGMFGRELIGFETRFALFAQEMLRNGINFFPTTYNLPYPDYPAGLTILNTLCALPWGKLTTFSAIFPSALANSFTLVLVYFIALPTSREWSRIAVLLALFTYEFFTAGRMLAMDPFIMLACTWAFYIAFSKNMPDENFPWQLYCPLVFGFLIRGPIGLVLPAAGVIAFFLAKKDWHAIKNFSLRAIVLFLILLGLLLAAAQYQGGSHFLHEVLTMQIFGRIEDHRTHDLFAYFTQSFVNYAVSFELAIISAILLFRRCIHDLLFRSLICWVLIILIGMSIPEVRKIRYIMPIVPALALLGARLWIEAAEQRSARIATDIFHGLCLALPFLFIVLDIAAIIVAHLKNFDSHAHYFSAFCTLGLFSLASIYIFFHHPIDYARRNSKKVIGLGLASFFSIIIFIIQPIEVSLERTKPFVTHVMNIQNNVQLTFFQLDKDAEPIQFMAALPQATPVEFAQEINFEAPNRLYVTTAQIFDALPKDTQQQLIIMLREKLGHREMVVFKINQSASRSE